MRNSRVGFLVGFATAVLMGWAAVAVLGVPPTHALEQQQLIEEAFANIGAKTSRQSTRPRASSSGSSSS